MGFLEFTDDNDRKIFVNVSSIDKVEEYGMYKDHTSSKYTWVWIGESYFKTSESYEDVIRRIRIETSR